MKRRSREVGFGSGRGAGGGGGGDRWRVVLGRVFGDAENPMGWGLTIGRVWGIRVRVHLFYIIYIIAQIIWSILPDQMGLTYMLMLMGTLFALVLLHEFGHCFACRWVGGEADDILMWPLGGLAACAPPRRWLPELITTLGGPAVNVAIVPATSLALWSMGHGRSILFNPFEPGRELAVVGGYWASAVFSAHFTNLALLAFNMLLPLYPLDGARTLHALLWRRMGERPATEMVVVIGLVVGVALGIFALVARETLLLGVAVFGLAVCWTERQRLKFAAEAPEEPDWARSARMGDDGGASPGPSRRDEKRREREEAERAQVDGLLEKIAQHGLQSLSAKEKRILQRATERKRGGG